MAEIFEALTSLNGLNLNVQLPVEIDQEKLLLEFHNVYSRFVESPQSGRYHDGGWKAIGLITSGGNPHEDRPQFIVDKPFMPSPAMEFCPYIQEFLENIPARKKRVRLMSLSPLREIKWHIDFNVNVDKNTNSTTVRLHIPIITTPQVEFKICHNVCQWTPGHLYYGDFSFPHKVKNNGNKTRIHLVIDIVPNEQIRKLFPNYFLEQEKKRSYLRKLCYKAYSIYLIKEKFTRNFLSFMLATKSNFQWLYELFS